MDTITELVNKYFSAKVDVVYCQDEWKKCIKHFQKILPYDNQTFDIKYAFKEKNDIKTDADAKKKWGEEIPLTMMPKSELYKKLSKDCAEWKKHFKFAQSQLSHRYNELREYIDRRTLWFIASVRDVDQKIPKIEGQEDLEGKTYHNHESRCWGFFYDLETAMEMVRNNATDMNEAGYYKYVVIEPKKQGLCYAEPSCSNRWFMAQYSKNEKGENICTGYVDCKEPEWAKQTVGWTIS